MASSRIKGITIDIGGNTQKLQDALKGVDKQIYGLNADLKDLNKALKLDPSNTELLAQKQDVLSRNIKNATDRLNALKEAQKQMGDYSKLTDEQKSQYNALSGEIAKTEKSIKDMNTELKNTTKIDLSGLKTGLTKVGEVAKNVGKELAKLTGVVAGALTGVVSLGVKSYAEYEQNLGGVETLFKLSEKEIKDYAEVYGMSVEDVKKDSELMNSTISEVLGNSKRAYKTAGVSANEYMKGITSFAASLLQSTKGNSWDAMEIADMAFQDMSDNANKFGTDMQSIQNAYQGFAKQNYTMLDNLKLGYGGTKTEMERLLNDAQKISKVKYNINNLGDIYNAIHVIQEEMGITGTTFKEATTTISGSLGMMKASFDNFINGSGGAEDLIESIGYVINNVSNAVMKLAPSILSGIPTLITNILPQIIEMITSLLPQLLNAITDMINQLFEMLTENKDSLANTITTLINDIVNFITENLPTILEMGIQILLALVQGIIDSLPTIIESAMTLLDTIIDTIIDNLDEIIDMALTLIITLATGLIDALPKLIAKVPTIITKLVEALCKPEMIIKLVGAALTLMIELGKGLIECIPQLLKVVPDLIKSLVKSFKETITNTDWGKLGSDIIKGILDGFGRIGNYITTKVNEVKDTITNKFKKIFGIASPSKLMKKEIGKYLAQGIGEGFTDEMIHVSNDMANAIPIDELITDYDSAMRSLTRGINSSVNPTINPSITYEQNYSMMSKAMKEALNDMVVDLDDREVGRFVSKTITNEVYGR